MPCSIQIRSMSSFTKITSVSIMDSFSIWSAIMALALICKGLVSLNLNTTCLLYTQKAEAGSV